MKCLYCAVCAEWQRRNRLSETVAAERRPGRGDLSGTGSVREGPTTDSAEPVTWYGRNDATL